MKGYKKWINRFLIVTAIYSFFSIIAGGVYWGLVTLDVQWIWMQEHVEFFYPGIFFAIMFILMVIGAFRNHTKYIKDKTND